MTTQAMHTIPVMKPWLGAEEAEAAAAAVASGWVAQGPRVAAFEEAVAARTDARYGVAVSSCTAALHLAMLCLGIGPGDEVVVPSLSFIATANAVRYVGAHPVFADVEAATQNLTPATVEAVLTPRTRAVILVHQAGVPADIDALQALCRPRDIAIVEDAACAIGSTYHDRPIGGHSDLVTLSFHPRKVITCGEGGMLLTTNADYADRARRLREHGMNVSAAARHASDTVVIEQYLETGWNFRMTDIQAAVGLVQLDRLDAIVTRRRELAARYHAALTDIVGGAHIDDPVWGRTNYQSYWIVLPDDFPMPRNEVLAAFAREGISGRRGIMASHLEPAYAGHPHIDLPVTTMLTERSMILPMFHEMTDTDQDAVVAAFRRAAARTA
ncbi:MAG TPA: DegT/DnrJ/EryC1/StrS family aminotransferase [Acidimicrobiia bacterium]|nr:DegT/DnrJ/EryC1/StrS family aminotransferase [Acidimicrobiia bacterium]